MLSDRAGGGQTPPGILAAFESPEFRWVWLSVLGANSGRFCVVLVAGYEAYRIGHSATWSGSSLPPGSRRTSTRAAEYGGASTASCSTPIGASVPVSKRHTSGTNP